MMTTLTPIYDALAEELAVTDLPRHALDDTEEWQPDWTLVPAAVHGQDKEQGNG